MTNYFEILDGFFGFLASPLLLAYIVLGIDDLIVDLYSWVNGLHPLAIPNLTPTDLRGSPQKRIAILVAAWKEQDVIERMIRGNRQRIEYDKYEFFIGVYPNDIPTVNAVLRIAGADPRVHMVMNRKNGPTSKGQMLNEVVRAVLMTEKTSQETYDAVLIHDCEDLIHPHALSAINLELDRAEFVQVPVFSLPLPPYEIIAGTYMDEFAESHSKDMRVRNALVSAIPSAGVGTALSRSLLLRYLTTFSGFLFNEFSLTEDYELGLRTRQLAAKSSFLFAKYRGEVIATREYFPRRFRGSIRQKTRWSVGIVYQGTKNLGWTRHWIENLFLFRDRKAPIANLVNFIGFLFFVYGLGRGLFGVNIVRHFNSTAFVIGTTLTLHLMANRLLQRAVACGRIYGLKSIALIPLRTLASNIINAFASLNAFRQVLLSRFHGQHLRWVKTDHELPKGFGNISTALILWLFAGLSVASVSPPAEGQECVRIYYDEANDPKYRMGEIYAIFLQNLMAHFPHYQQIVKPVELYKPGELNDCHASFYIANFFENAIPQSFLDDYTTTQKTVVWLGYSIWRLGDEALKRTLGIEYKSLTTLNLDTLDSTKRPTFFKLIHYKDETFQKFGEFSKPLGQQNQGFLSAFEMAAVRVIDPDTQVLATAEHNGTREKLPYALRKGRRFYLADVPMSFMHESDRYLVFADLLFDMLDEKPRYPKERPAVFRLEDLQAKTPQYRVYKIIDVVKRLQVPLNVALIPIFYDPLNRTNRTASEELIFLSQDPLFMQLIGDLKKLDTSFVWHGVTHQYNETPNPHDAVSGNDFEFWDTKKNRAIAEDSVPYVLHRLEDGWRTLNKAGLYPDIWETPHYQASPLDYQMFARLFFWNIGRVIYYPIRTVSLDFPGDLRFLNLGTSGSHQRLSAFGQIDPQEAGTPAGQFFPFEIYGDVYGQRLLPENMGNPQPYQSHHVLNPRSIDNLLDLARRNIKLRDVWGSFFFHPQLVDPYYGEGMGAFPGDTRDLERVLSEMQKMGYRFISLNKFIQNHQDLRKPSQWTSRRQEFKP